MTDTLSFALSVQDPSEGASVAHGSQAASSSQVKFNDLMKALSGNSHSIEAGTVLFNPHEIPLHAFLLLKGVIRLDCSPSPQMVGPGAVIGLAEGLAQTSISFEALAATRLEVVEISVVDIERALGHAGKTLQGIARLAMERVLHDRIFGNGA
jgi:CRP-like cAMP-binding protein